MKRYFLLVLITLFNVACTMAQKKIDLTDIKFTENAGDFLKGIPAHKKTSGPNAITYKINDPQQCAFAHVVPEFNVEVGAQNNIISSYYAHTQKTVSSNLLLKALVAKYGQPTTKVKDDGDVKAYYWETPALFIQYMAGKVESPHNGTQVFSFIHTSTMKAIKAGADPDFTHVHDLVQQFK